MFHQFDIMAVLLLTALLSPVLVSTFDLVPNSERCERITVPLCEDAPYNYTRMPNMLGHLDQMQAARAMADITPQWLKGITCSKNLKFFLCSIYTPMCTNQVDYAIVACRSVCEEVRHLCSPVLQSFGLQWPDMLNCTKFPEKNSEPLCMEPSTPEHSSAKSGHTGADWGADPAKSYPGSGNTGHSLSPVSCKGLYIALESTNKHTVCAPNCEANIRFSRRDKDFAEIWMTIWASLCLLATMLTIVTLIMDRNRFSYPERPIIWMSVCYGMYSIGYLARLFLGAKLVSCGQGVQDCSYLVQGGLESSEWCVVIFLILYYFGTASSLWWVILTVSWFLAVQLKWSTEALEAKCSYFHLVAWAIPAIQAIVVLITKRVDADELTGLCFVGNNDPSALLGFSIVPQGLYLAVGTVFIIAGFIGSCRLRREIRNFARASPVPPAGAGRPTTTENPSRFEKLLLRIGMFALLYIVAASFVIGCQIYEKIHLDSQPDLLSRCQRNPATSERPLQVELFMLKIFMSLVVGITSGMWVWSKKTCRAWSTCCCIYVDNKKTGHGHSAQTPLPIFGGAPSGAVLGPASGSELGTYSQSLRLPHEKKRLLPPGSYQGTSHDSAGTKL